MSIHHEQFRQYMEDREQTRRVLTEDGVPERMQDLYFEGKDYLQRFAQWCRDNNREYLAGNLERLSTDLTNEVLNFGDPCQPD